MELEIILFFSIIIVKYLFLKYDIVEAEDHKLGYSVGVAIISIADDISESIYSAFNTSVGGTIEEIIIRPQFGDI